MNIKKSNDNNMQHNNTSLLRATFSRIKGMTTTKTTDLFKGCTAAAVAWIVYIYIL